MRHAEKDLIGAHETNWKGLIRAHEIKGLH